MSLEKLMNKYYVRILVLVLLVGIGWIGFIYLAGYPPVEETSALIMVWISILLIILAIFPSILNRIKRIKFKDIEVELSDIAREAAEDQVFQINDLDDNFLTEKSNLNNLVKTFKIARINRGKPILLIANIKSGYYISIPMLFIYLYLLDISGISVNILFYKSNQSSFNGNLIKDNSIIGAINGKKFLTSLCERYKWLLRVYSNNFNNSNLSLDDLISDSKISNSAAESFLRNMNDRLREFNDNRDEEYLDEKTIIYLAGENLCKRIADLGSIGRNNNILRDALEKSDEFIILTEGNAFKAVVALCKISNTIALRVIKNSQNS
jgi:hypothetical protein